MKIKSFKKSCIKFAVLLIVIGVTISIIGFGTARFDMSKFKETNTHKWYRTIRIDGSSCSFGL